MDDALLLSRIQFAFVISFHILFPAFTIGLASWLAFLEGAYLRTKDAHYRDLYFFWLKIFAVSFGMGVVSGIVMSFQFGTNWARFSEATGNILGPLLSRRRQHGLEGRAFVAFGGYFSLIGLGFMLVEIGLMQKFSILLGHPIYSLSITLMSMILASGNGFMPRPHATANDAVPLSSA